MLSLAGLLAWGLLSPGDPSVDSLLADKQAPLAPAFDLPLLEGGSLPPQLSGLGSIPDDGRLTIEELDGTPFVLNIWASWCEPCREEAETLERQWQASGRQGVLFLGLNIQDVPEDARSFLREFDITYPNIREDSNETARAYGSGGLPETFFVTEDGRIVGHILGVVTSSQLAEGVRAARTERLLGTRSGGASSEQR